MNELQPFDLAKPTQAIQVAQVLQDFVKKNNLTASIQGKQYPLVEAWTFAGSQFGLIPIVKTLECLSSAHPLSGDSEIKYRSEVEVMNVATGLIVGRGIAICSNKEYSKKKFDEYAIASMAQTRATGKAFRIPLGWLMKASGFEATPSEEMDFVKDEVGDESRDFLLSLLDSSTYEGKVRDRLRSRITDILTHSDYDKAKIDLLANQVGIDGVVNPSAKDINRQVKNIAKQPAA
jgi:hypothetical protein